MTLLLILGTLACKGSFSHARNERDKPQSAMLILLAQIDQQKAARIFDFLVHSGWIQKA